MSLTGVVIFSLFRKQRQKPALRAKRKLRSEVVTKISFRSQTPRFLVPRSAVDRIDGQSTRCEARGIQAQIPRNIVLVLAAGLSQQGRAKMHYVVR